jgi:large subunit ribosomal protein L1
VDLLRETSKVNFDPSAEAHIRLGVDPRHADQMVRGTVVLPHGVGKTVRVVAFAQGDKAQEALRAGADEVGGEDLVKRIEAGWLEFDVALATPDMMGQVGKLGRILGRRGLMPNPKSGTITFDLDRAIREVKAGRVEFKVDKTGIIHVPFGKASFESTQLVDNLATLIDAINRAKPTAVKGSYFKSLTIAATMGPGIRVDVPGLLARAAAA